MRVDGFVPAAGTIQNTGGDILSKLKLGDTVRAQVLENSGSELSLKLSDGSTVLASSSTPVDASEGEYVNFVFRGIVDGKPALEVANRNVQPQIDSTMENIKNTLTGLNLPVTDKNIELVQALQKQNIPVNAENMSKAMNLMSNNTQLKADSAAFLTAANMSDNQNNIEKLQNLLAGRLKISNDIGDLLKLIGNDGKNSDESAKLTMVNNILGKLSAEMSAKGQISNTPANSATVALNETVNGAKVMNSNMSAIPANSKVATANGSNSATASTVVNSNVNAAVDSIANNTVNSNASLNVNNTKNENNTVINNNSSNASEALSSAKDLDSNVNTVAQGKAATQQTENSNNVNVKGNQSHIEQQISNLLKGGEPFVKEDLTLLNKLNSRLESLINGGELSAEELSASKLIAKEIEASIFKIQSGDTAFDQLNTAAKGIKNFEATVNNLKNLFIKIDQNSDEINPVKLYKNMEDALQALKTSIQQLPMSMQQTAMNIVGNLESNMSFINQLNNYSSYVQIPLSIFNQNTTGELYMLKRGSKSKKLDASNMTVLISLDSTNIGRIDTLLSVDKKNISTNFRLENSEVFDVLKENHKMLYTSLLEKGFRLVDFTYRLLEEPLSIVNFEEEAKKEFIKNPNNIDLLI